LRTSVVEMLRTADSIAIHDEAAGNLWGVSSSLGSIKFSDSTSSVIGQPSAGQTLLLSFAWFGNSALAKDARCGSAMASTVVPSDAAIIRRSFKHYLFAPILAVLLVSSPGVALTQKATTMAKASPIENLIEAVGKIRKSNKKTMIDCTELVDIHLGKSDNISYYIDLFKKSNIDPVMVRQNQKNFVNFTIDYDRLRSVTHNFSFRDYITVVFVTEKLTHDSPIVSHYANLLSETLVP
jgi:hypothetical protein